MKILMSASTRALIRSLKKVIAKKYKKIALVERLVDCLCKSLRVACLCTKEWPEKHRSLPGRREKQNMKSD